MDRLTLEVLAAQQPHTALRYVSSDYSGFTICAKCLSHSAVLVSKIENYQAMGVGDHCLACHAITLDLQP